MKNKDKKLSAEMEMIKDLRKRVYGNSEVDEVNKVTADRCVFCGSEFKLHTYKNNFICHDCFLDIKNSNWEL